jgi:hypothetical protein
MPCAPLTVTLRDRRRPKSACNCYGFPGKLQQTRTTMSKKAAA